MVYLLFLCDFCKFIFPLKTFDLSCCLLFVMIALAMKCALFKFLINLKSVIYEIFIKHSTAKTVITTRWQNQKSPPFTHS